MTIPLPVPLTNYFAAKNRHDIEAMLAPFAQDAVVRDEGKTHSGRAQIGAWMIDTTKKYRVTVEPVDASSAGDTWKVAALVSGNFPGSPATLHYRFTLADDQIAKLEIGA